jgi:hypothetical protein
MSAPTNKIKQAGDVTIDDVTIITSRGFAQTITPQVIGIEIYEDIFATFITGKLMIKDAQALMNLLPLVGEESIRLQVSTPSLPESAAYKREFFIYKMDDVIKTSARETLYVLHFISKEAITDLNRKISKAYSGKVSDIVSKIIKDPDGLSTTKTTNIEETKNKIKYTSNFWRPSKNMQFLTDNAESVTGSPSYLFFENKYGFNFVSLETLYTGTPLQQRFIADNYTAEINPLGGSSASIERDYQRVLDMQTPATFNYMDRIASGFYGSEIIYYDILTKQYVHTGYVPDFKKDGKHLNPHQTWTENNPSRPKALLLHENQYYNNFEGFDVTSNTKIVQKRKALLAQAESNKVIITVFGRMDYSAGQRVYLNVPVTGQISATNTDPEDKLLSGNYLIAALCHFINRESHECTIELIKDSYLVDINDSK